MQPDKWEQIKGRILDSFGEIEESVEPLLEPEVGQKEIIIFIGPLGRMKLEYVTKPVILDKRTHGSRRIGSHTQVEYVYSRDEFNHQFSAYRWDEEAADWQEMALEKESFNL